MNKGQYVYIADKPATLKSSNKVLTLSKGCVFNVFDGTVNGEYRLSPTAFEALNKRCSNHIDTSKGFYSHDGTLYLSEKSIGDKVRFAADGKQHTGTIVRINGLTKDITEHCKYVSIDDDVETAVDDDGVEKPINWSLYPTQFELVNQLPRYT